MPIVVNVMVDYDIPSHPTADQVSASHNGLEAIINEIAVRKVNTTVYLTTEAASITQERLYLTAIGRDPILEYALNGNNSGERLSTMPYSQQRSLLALMKKHVDSAHYCGLTTRNALGFRPQLFDQNEDTFKVLDEMEMVYDSGFKAGVLYQPGHENDVWPYPVKNHKFYAVPVSTVDLSGDRVCLQDKYIRDEKKQSATQWGELLTGKFDEASRNGEPVVVIFSTSVSGSGNYFDALKKFLDYAASKNARFVTTMELVDIAKGSAVTQIPSGDLLGANATSTNATNTTECPTCETTKNVSVNTSTNNNTSAVVTLGPISFSEK